jgi:predicted metal-dependent RNase
MAQRKEDLSHNKHQAAPTTKRSRITIDVSPELRRRIKLAALQHDLSISEYVGDILEEVVPKEASTAQRQHHPITHEAIERLKRISEQIMQDRGGKLFENTAEMIRQMREERSKYLGEL